MTDAADVADVRFALGMFRQARWLLQREKKWSEMWRQVVGNVQKLKSWGEGTGWADVEVTCSREIRLANGFELDETDSPIPWTWQRQGQASEQGRLEGSSARWKGGHHESDACLQGCGFNAVSH